MNKNIASLVIASAFANATPAAASATPAKKAGAPKAEERIAPVFTAPVATIAIPVGKPARGQKSELAKQLEALEIGFSIGLKNKTKKQISSTLSKINNAASNLVQKMNADGSPAYKNGEAIKDANGNIVSYKQVPEMVSIKEFVAYDRTAADKDPEGATVRIWRTK